MVVGTQCDNVLPFVAAHAKALDISDSVTWRVGVWLSQYSSSFPGSQALGEPPSKFALLAVSFFGLCL